MVDKKDDLARLGLAAWARSHRPTHWFGTDWWAALVDKTLRNAKEPVAQRPVPVQRW